MFGRNAWRTAARCNRSMRSYASNAPSHGGKLRIGYVPGPPLPIIPNITETIPLTARPAEHFATPLQFAQRHFALDADLIPQPEGTGALASRLKASEPERQLDVAFGLTEGFIADLGKTRAAGDDAGYALVGTYVQSPLRWALSTGGTRDDITSVEGLKGTKVGVSRVGSGSYVMSFVLAEEKGWGQEAFEVVPLGKFEELRRGVKEGSADWFMWDHTTSSKFWGNGELKRIGEIYTPWPSWTIAARNRIPTDELEEVMQKVNQGVQYFQENVDQAIEHITGTMHYSEKDAREWLATVRFSEDVVGVDPAVVDRTAETLRKVGVLGEGSGGSEEMVAILRGA